jgi:hypothetical protein
MTSVDGDVLHPTGQVYIRLPGDINSIVNIVHQIEHNSSMKKRRLIKRIG